MIDEPAAIVHDWFQGMHGSERVVDTIRSGLFAAEPGVDVMTFAAARDLIAPDLAKHIVRASRLASLPGLRQAGHGTGRWRYLLPYMPHYFASLELAPYDVVIASSHACAVQARPRPEALYVCYCHTPMRYAWLPDTESGRNAALGKLGLRLFRGYLRRTDLAASRRPHAYAANSRAVRDRIRRFYGREAVVIHPPVEVKDFTATAEKEQGHFLWAHRLVAYKKPELVAEAFRDLPYRLTMVGVGPLEKRLRGNLPPNVELRGWLPRTELAGLYERAAGFLHVGEEDFGITMVEALAAGTPVIALNAGGASDVVRHGVDGLLLERSDLADVRAAIRAAATSSWEPRKLRDRAEEFSGERFLRRMREWLEESSWSARGHGLRWASPAPEALR